MSETTGPNDALPPIIPLDEPPPPPAAFTSPPEIQVLRPIPFEDLEAIPDFWARVGAMFRLVFSNPMELFDRVPTTGGLGAPWRFLLLMSVPVFLVTALLFFLLGMGIMVAALEEAGKPEDLRKTDRAAMECIDHQVRTHARAAGQVARASMLYRAGIDRARVRRGVVVIQGRVVSDGCIASACHIQVAVDDTVTGTSNRMRHH